MTWPPRGNQQADGLSEEIRKQPDAQCIWTGFKKKLFSVELPPSPCRPTLPSEEQEDSPLQRRVTHQRIHRPCSNCAVRRRTELLYLESAKIPRGEVCEITEKFCRAAMVSPCPTIACATSDQCTGECKRLPPEKARRAACGPEHPENTLRNT